MGMYRVSDKQLICTCQCKSQFQIKISIKISILLSQLKQEIFHPKSEDGVPHCEDANCGGVVRPDVVLFGEALPEGVTNLP